MKSIKARFLKASEQQSGGDYLEGGYLGGYSALAEAVKGQRFTKYAISKSINELLVEGDGEDYMKSDRKDLLNELYELSNFSAEEPKIEGKFVTGASSIIKGVVSVVRVKTI